jgi:hypothetical protein
VTVHRFELKTFRHVLASLMAVSLAGQIADVDCQYLKCLIVSHNRLHHQDLLALSLTLLLRSTPRTLSGCSNKLGYTDLGRFSIEASAPPVGWRIQELSTHTFGSFLQVCGIDVLGEIDLSDLIDVPGLSLRQVPLSRVQFPFCFTKTLCAHATRV